MEKLMKPAIYSAEGIKTHNNLEQSIIDFCVKVGVDPKYYEEIFQDIAKINCAKKPISKQLTFFNAKKQNEELMPPRS